MKFSMKYTTILLLFFISISINAQPIEANLLGQWSKNGLAGSTLYNNTYNEIWGLAKGGKEYAVMGSTAGTHFIDVTNPSQPIEKFFVEGGFAGASLIHRDYHDYECYLYAVADEGNTSKLQIIDLSDLPNSIEVVYDENNAIARAHNIFIDTAAARLYAFATFNGSNNYKAIKVFDLSDPLNPTLLGGYNNFGGVSISHVHDGYVENNLAYLNCGSHGLLVVDFTDAQNPILKSTLTEYSGAGYNHSGWLHDDQQYYYMADETWGSDIKVLDVSDLSDIKEVATLDAGVNNPNSIPHNQIVACDYLYTSYYYDGLQVYDISNPATPNRTMYYDTSDETYDDTYEGAWGIYPFLPSGNILLSDMQKGLFIFEGIADQCERKQATNCGLLSETKDLPTFGGSLHIFPQPAQDYLSISFKADQDYTFVKLHLIDITGRILSTTFVKYLPKGENSLSLSLNDVPNGIYFLKLESDEFQIAKKVIIQK